jgi:hypothetical protein
MARKKNQPKSSESLPAPSESQCGQSKGADKNNREGKDIALSDDGEERVEFTVADFALKGLHASNALLRIYVDAAEKLLNVLPNFVNSPLIRRFFEHRMELEKERERTRSSQLLAKADIDRAIAKRIESSASMEIEETFDASAKGHAGASKVDKGAQIGIGAVGQRLVKRKIILTGTTTGGQDDGRIASAAIVPAMPKPPSEELPPPPSSESIEEKKKLPGKRAD